MSDQEIIDGLIARDSQVTEEFFFRRCRPLLLSIMQLVFDFEVNYDEMVNELYLYLMEDDAYRLRHFLFRSSVYQWVKVLSVRYFIKKRNRMIENRSHETPYEETAPTYEPEPSAQGDLQRLFDGMPTQRYVHVIRRLVIDGADPEEVAVEMNVSVANLYNIKRRAIAQLSRVAIKDISSYQS